MSHPLIDSVAAHAQMFVKLRRELQLAAERGQATFRTSDMVAGRLEHWGYKVARGLEGGVVAQLRRGQGAKRLGLRADMGGLSLQQAGGQFGHTAMLLAAAHYLARQGDFSGTLNLVFQPADAGQGDARGMVAGGLFAQYPCDAIFAMRSIAGHPQGRLLLGDGPVMASSDVVTITLHGADDAKPHAAADPVVAGAAIVMGLQNLVARNLDPLQTALVQVEAFEGGAAGHAATLRLRVQALDRGVRGTLERSITRLAELQALSYGVHAAVDYQRQAPVLVNGLEQTEFARQVAQELLGHGEVAPLAGALSGELPGSDDFAFLLEQVPGSYLLIGNGEASEQDFNERNLPIGAAYWAMLAQCYLH